MRKPVLALALCSATLCLTGAAYAAPDAGPHGSRHGPASRAEAQARSDELFSKLDVNGDGVIDPKDRQAREAERFAMLDTDHNGALSPQEFAAGPGPRGPGGPGPFAGKGPGPDAPLGPPPIAMHGMHGMRGMGGPGFGPGPLAAEADSNKDGAVSKAEFAAFTLAHFDEADADHDGTLSKAERHAARKDRHEERGGWRDHGPAGE